MLKEGSSVDELQQVREGSLRDGCVAAPNLRWERCVSNDCGQVRRVDQLQQELQWKVGLGSFPVGNSRSVWL